MGLPLLNHDARIAGQLNKDSPTTLASAITFGRWNTRSMATIALASAGPDQIGDRISFAKVM